MSVSEGTRRAGVSRRSVVKGAAWAVPAVAVASAAPAMAASKGPISFTGKACKLPGNSGDVYKGYVFELISNNEKNKNPLDAVTVVTDVKIDGVSVGFGVYDKTAHASCSCGPCGSVPTHEFCSPDGLDNQRILVFTKPDATGSSKNAEMSITYQQYDCNGGTTCGPIFFQDTITSGVLSTLPVQGAQCTIADPTPTNA